MPVRLLRFPRLRISSPLQRANSDVVFLTATRFTQQTLRQRHARSAVGKLTGSHFLKTRSKRIRSGAVLLAKVVARVVLAACLALSFFASLVPLRVSADDGAMACCAGKAGHCNSGLLAKQPAKQASRPKLRILKSEPEELCGLNAAAGGAVIAEDAEIIDANEVVAEATESQDATKSTQPESQPDATASVQGASMTKPCPADCRAGMTGVVRQPRPREIALLAKNIRGSLPEQANWKPHSLETNLAASTTLKCSRPRGPPLPA